MKLRRIMLAAPKSGSGKTTITCALLQALKDCGEQVISYKCGPDYIDPMFHRSVIGVPSKNLDTFFTGEEVTKELFLQDRTENDFAVIEGVMGLYDGLGGVREEGSSYHLAVVTKTPIILVVDAKGMGRSIIPMIAGFLSYDKEHLIKGIILNRMSGMYYNTIKPLIEAELPVKVVGYLPDRKEGTLASRHLGLVMPQEIPDLRASLKELTEEFVKTVSIDEIITFGNQVSDLNCKHTLFVKNKHTEVVLSCKKMEKPGEIILAVARDEAFCFYYEDNLRMLENDGVTLRYFSPVHDKKLPDGCCGILLGGGYPELYADRLSQNQEILVQIRDAIAEGMPVVAECGGFMYLHESMTVESGECFPMVGAIKAQCEYKRKLVRFGYIELEEQEPNFLPNGQKIRAHEFHYFDSTDNGSDCIATKPVTGRTYPCVIDRDNVWLGYAHLYYPSNPEFAHAFVRKVCDYAKIEKYT